MLARLSSAFLLSLWILLPVLAALLAQRQASMVVAAVIYVLIVASIFTHQLLARPSSERLAEPVARLRKGLKRLAWIWGAVLLCFQSGVVLRILAERGTKTWVPIREISSFLVRKLSPFLPALRDFPSDMIQHGFTRTAAVVTESYALAYTAALINLGISLLLLVWLFLKFSWRGELASIPQNFDSMPGEKRILMFLGWPLLFAFYVYVVFIDTDVSATVGRREYIPHFETSEFHLYFRTLLGTGLNTLGICAMLWSLVLQGSAFVAVRSGRAPSAT